MSTLENKCAKLVSRLLRKSCEIDDLMYSYQNSITVKEEQAQLNDMFKILMDIHEEFEKIDKDYTDDIWFDDIDQKVFSFKYKMLTGWKKRRKNIRKITHQGAVQDQVLLIQIFNSRKSSGGETEGGQVNCRSFFHAEKERC